MCGTEGGGEGWQLSVSYLRAELCTCVRRPTAATKRNGECPRGPDDLLTAI